MTSTLLQAVIPSLTNRVMSRHTNTALHSECAASAHLCAAFLCTRPRNPSEVFFEISNFRFEIPLGCHSERNGRVFSLARFPDRFA